MKISMQAMSVDVFISMLTSLSEILDKGAEHAQAAHLDLINARLAPDMYPLSQQVRIACDQARNGVARITGAAPTVSADEDKTFDDLKARIAGTIEFLRSVRAPDFEGAEERDCSIPGPNGIVFQMNGLEFLRAWALPNFYFHVSTAYGILRHNGVDLGKKDYLSQARAFIRMPK